MLEPARDNVIPFLQKPAHELKVLVVDDDRLERAFLQQQIQDLGHAQILHATNGREAIALLEKYQTEIGVILMDRLMPVMDGLSAVWEIKSNNAWVHIPIIMVTSATTPEDIEQGIDAGVFYYLVKPADQNILRSVFSAAMREAKQARNLIDELKRHKTSFNLITTCQFTFQTLEEAECLAAFIALCFPNPQRVLTGLAELLINAVEHGNLEIGYAQKTELLDNNIWQAEVARRLTLEHFRRRRAQVMITRKDGGMYVVITDEGKGFDWRRYLTIDPVRAGDNHGRGIAQARAISFDKLSYNESGNQVIAFSSFEDTVSW